MSYILGISAFYHDSTAFLVRDGEILAAAQEERFTRKKHDPRFPSQAIRYCLRERGISLTDLRDIVFCGLLTPMGLIIRLFGKDSMQRQFVQEAHTFRVMRKPRPHSHMMRQF